MRGLISHRIRLYKCVAWLLCLASLFSLLFASSASAEESPKRVLILNSYHKGYEWSDALVEAASNRLFDSVENLDLHVEYLDTKRVRGEEYFGLFKSMMRIKYGDHQPDGIISSDDDALNFLLRNRDELFPGVPVVYCGVNEHVDSKRLSLMGYIGTPDDLDVSATLDIALKLRPRTRKVLVLSDASATGKAQRQSVKQIEFRFPGLEFSYYNGEDHSLGELLSALSRLSDDYVVLLTVWLQDDSQHYVPFSESYPLISSSATVPVFGLTDLWLGYGIVGGKLNGSTVQGDRAAEILLDLFATGSANRASWSPRSFQNPYMFDYEQLARWNMDISLLPEGSVLINEVDSFYERYQHLLAGAALALGLAMLMIALLLANVLRRRRAEAEIFKAKQFLDEIIDALDDPVLVKDEQHRWVALNDSACALLGADKESLLGKSEREFFPDEAARVFRERDDEVFRTGQTMVNEKEFVYQGRRQILSTKTSLFTDSATGNKYLVASLRDITETKRLQEFATRAQRLETAGRIAGQVAHDFNNLLGPLVAYPELIRADLPDGHEACDLLSDMERAATQISEINQQLLTLGRRGHYNLEPMNLNDLVTQVLAEYAETIGAGRVNTETDSSLLNVRGGYSQIYRAVSNLIVNAVDAMSGEGVLTVSTANVFIDTPTGSYTQKPLAEYVRLSVSDTGPGIAPDIRSRIFDPFFSTKSANRERGSGLGLSIVHAVIEDHDGYVDCDSVVGRGTTFSIYLPVTREPISAGAVENIACGSERILVVDDDRLQGDVTRTLLEKLGYTVRTATSGEAALSELRQESFDLLVLDMIMPGGMDGTETFRHCRELNPDQKAIIVSGYAESKRVQEAQLLGAGPFIRKPLTLKSIASAVRRELDRVDQPQEPCPPI